MHRKQMLGFMVCLALLVFSSYANAQWVDRPIPAGVSIGSVRPDDQGVLRGGTLGCMLWGILYIINGVTYYSCDLWGLTNRHVLDPGEGTAVAQSYHPPRDGDLIMQPRQGNPSTDVVGELYQMVEIDTRPKAVNKVDACIFRSKTNPDTGEKFLRWDGSIQGIGYIFPVMETATVGMDVAKSGMSTNVTYSTVERINEVYYMPWNGKTTTFVDQLAIDLPFCAEGDSGAIVISWPSKCPVGLLTGTRIRLPSGEEVAVANKIQNVMAAFPGKEIAGYTFWPMASEALASDHPGAWMRDGNPRFEEIKKIQERFRDYLEDRLKPIKELVSLGTGADDQGEPYFLVAINYKREEVIEEKGLPEVWEGIPVKYELSTEIKFK